MYEKPSCHVSGTYLYVPVRTGQEFLYLHVPVHTGTYRYIPVRTIWPDPVHVFRIPDACHTVFIFLSYSCQIVFIFLSRFFHFLVIFLQYLSYILARLLSYICHVAVIFLS
jgi:hypothetical protein